MMKRIRLLLFVIMIACVQVLHAQGDKKIHLFGHTEIVDSTLLEIHFHKNAPRDFPVHPVPGAVYVGKDNKFLLGLGGFIKVITGVDVGHPIENTDEFITSQIPMGAMDGNNVKYSLSAKQTHVYLNFIALPGEDDEIGAFISANLLNDYIPVVQYAYLRYRGLKAGYDNTVFSDPECGGPTVDYEGPCSNTASPVGGISYIWSPKKRPQWELSAGIEQPQASFTTIEGKTNQVHQRVPDIPMAARFKWDDEASWVRGSAILRTLTYRDITQSRNHSRLGYGFQVSGAYYFLDRLTFYWQGVWGKGIGSIIQDTAGEEIDLTPTDNGETLEPAMEWGGFLSLECEITPKLTASATYSHLRAYAQEYEGGTTEWPNLFKYTQYVSANLFYRPLPFFEIGLENIWGRRVNQDGMKCADNRLQLAFQLEF